MRFLVLSIYCTVIVQAQSIQTPTILMGPASTPTYTFALDATSHGSEASSATINVSHVVTAADGNRKLYVGIAYWGCDAINVSTVTYNSDAMTLVGAVCSGATTQHVSFYALDNPDVGTHNISVGLSGNPYSLIVGGWSFVGVNQTTSNGWLEDSLVTSGTGGLIIPSSAGNIVIGMVTANVVGDVGAEDWTETPDLQCRGYYAVATGSTTTLICDMDGSRSWTFAGIAVKGN